jgi:hypothetical protein
MLFERHSDRLAPVVNLPAFLFDRASVVSPTMSEDGRATMTSSAGPG